MRLLLALTGFVIFTQTTVAQTLPNNGPGLRNYWLAQMDKMARPVMENLASDALKAIMPVELSIRSDNTTTRYKVAYLEAFGRTLSGMGPWLNGEGGDADEVTLRNQYRQWALKATANAVNPTAKDYMLWSGTSQPLVDASFFALGLVRCPWLWNNLSAPVKQQVVTALLETRNIIPAYNNWVLFSAMIETFFCKYNLPYDKVRIEFGIREFEQHWYSGDGMFSDGMHFAMDYYNSYVIQPYLQAIMEVALQQGNRYAAFAPKFEKISSRYAEIQERMINADGTYPILGRSIVYRGGAFQHLADMALRKKLPPGLLPAQVRGALSAVVQKTMEAPGTFNQKGWLTIGVFGSQPNVADSYNNTGSLYLCANIFLPLGLPPTDAFWTAPAAPWTAVKVWTGQDAPKDSALQLDK